MRRAAVAIYASLLLACGGDGSDTGGGGQAPEDSGGAYTATTEEPGLRDEVCQRVGDDQLAATMTAAGTQDITDVVLSGRDWDPAYLTIEEEAKVCLWGGEQPYYVVVQVRADATIEGDGEARLAGGDESGSIIDIAGDHDVVVRGVVLEEATSGHLELNSTGGGVVCNGATTLLVENVHFDKNTADSGAGIGLLQSCQATVRDSEFTDNAAVYSGGGIYVGQDSSLVVERSTLAGGSAVEGGGVYVEDGNSVVVTDVEFNTNLGWEAGGGMMTWGGTGELTRVVFTANEISDVDDWGSGGAGLFVGGGTMTLTDAHFTLNKGEAALRVYGGSATVRGSADGTATFTSNEVQAAVVEGGGSLILDTVSLSSNATGVVALDDATLELHSTRLTENGSEGTVYPGTAVYAEGSKTLTLNNVTLDGNKSLAGGAICLIRAGQVGLEDVAFQDSAAATDGGALYIKNTTVTMTSGSFYKNGAVGSEESRGGAVYAELDENSKITFNDVFFDENKSASHGGGIYVTGGELALGAPVLAANYTLVQGRGGGLYCREATVSGSVELVENRGHEGGGAYLEDCPTTLTDSEFTDNQADQAGGGLASATFGTANLKLTDTSFTGNSADTQGGGAHLQGASATLDEVSFSENKAKGSDGSGGSLSLTGNTTLTMTGGGISDGTAELSGGGLYVESSFASLYGVTIHDNEAQGSEGRGGGVHATLGATFGASDLTLTENSASENGGGLYLNDTQATFTGTTTISANTSDNDGGGLYMTDGCTVTFSDTATVEDNEASDDGGGIVSRESELNLSGVTLTDNQAADDGGGLYLADDTVATVNGGTLLGNSAGDIGGGLCLKESTATVESGTVIQENDADGGGGAYVSESVLTATSVTFTGNTASHGGGLMVEEQGQAYLTEVNLEDSHASNYGGGITTDYGHVELTSCTLQNNTTDGDTGGGVLIYHSSMDVYSTSFAGNSPQDTSLYYYIGYFDDDGVWIDAHYVDQDWGANASFSCSGVTCQ